jgi:hypothetical protein
MINVYQGIWQSIFEHRFTVLSAREPTVGLAIVLAMSGGELGVQSSQAASPVEWPADPGQS